MQETTWLPDSVSHLRLPGSSWGLDIVGGVKRMISVTSYYSLDIYMQIYLTRNELTYPRSNI